MDEHREHPFLLDRPWCETCDKPVEQFVSFISERNGDLVICVGCHGQSAGARIAKIDLLPSKSGLIHIEYKRVFPPPALQANG
jgi:hypothetical protein